MKIFSRNFLYNLLTIFVLFSLLMVMDTCTKDELVPIDKFNIIKNEYTATGKTVNLNCHYSYPGIIQRAVIHYSKDSLLTNDLKSAQCTVENNQYLKVDIDNLQALTTYYGYYEVDNGIENHKTEPFVFKTKNYTPTTITTNAATNISFNKATLHGNISNDGELSIIERGFCISKTNSNPTISDTHYTSGNGTGSFSLTVGSLNPYTIYHYCAYAKNSNNEYIYGNVLHFTTTNDKPTVVTVSATATSSTTARGVGNITNDGGSAITARGFCWSTNSNPTISNSHTSDGTGNGMFNSYISNLSTNTTYYMRAYAQNANGVSYGDVISVSIVTCPSSVSDYDGNTYYTVQIGNQCWMKQNLRTTHYADGTYISLGSSSTSTTTAYRYYPNNVSSNVSTYGYLYNWKAVMRNSSSSSANPSGVQGICPTGWHVPSDAEWTQLTGYVGSQSQYVCGSNNTYIAKALASTTGWNSSSNTCAVGNNPSANNATGFSAVPAGRYYGDYDHFGIGAYFWSATQYSEGASYHGLGYGSASVYWYYDGESYGFSVRCLRD